MFTWALALVFVFIRMGVTIVVLTVTRLTVSSRTAGPRWRDLPRASLWGRRS